MKSSYRNSHVPLHLEKIHHFIDDAREHFAALSPSQLGWKPAKSQWSVRECLDHIMTTNSQYYPQFDKIIGGYYEPSVWGKLPAAWHRFWGQKLVAYLGPEVTQKSKSPGVFKPSAGRLNPTIVRDFEASLKVLSSKIESLDEADQHTVILSSPVSKLVTYSLSDALQIIVGHTERHMLQAKRVMESPGFPAK